jgi:hypothetical protein
MYQDFYDEHNSQNVLKAYIFGAIKSIEVHTRFWWGNLREGEHMEDLGTVEG